MRDLGTLKTCSICLLVLAAAACRGPAGNNATANETNAVAANETVPAPGGNTAANGAQSNAAAANDAAAAGSYRAFGTEPYWTVTIGQRRMRYEPAEGTPVGEPLPARTPIANGYRYVGTQMTVQIVHRTCDEAGEEHYPDEVRVTVGGRTLEGCGGTPSGELG